MNYTTIGSKPLADIKVGGYFIHGDKMYKHLGAEFYGSSCAFTWIQAIAVKIDGEWRKVEDVSSRCLRHYKVLEIEL